MTGSDPASDVLASSRSHHRFPAPFESFRIRVGSSAPVSLAAHETRCTCETRAVSCLVWFRDEGLTTRTPDVVPEPECHWCARESASCISGEVRDAHVPPSPRLSLALRVNGPRPSTVARPHRPGPPCGGLGVRPRDTLGRRLQPTLIRFSSRAPASRAATGACASGNGRFTPPLRFGGPVSAPEALVELPVCDSCRSLDVDVFLPRRPNGAEPLTIRRPSGRRSPRRRATFSRGAEADRTRCREAHASVPTRTAFRRLGHPQQVLPRLRPVATPNGTGSRRPFTRRGPPSHDGAHAAG